MSEQTAEAPEATPETEQKPDTEQTPEPDYRAEADKWKALARKHEEKAKVNAEKAKGYDELKQSHMTEQEKAVEQAKAEARAEVLRETAPERVRLAFEAIAGSRMTAEQIEEFLEDVDTSKYLTETGAVDRERVGKKVDALAPKQQDDDKRDLFPDLGQGVRATAAASSDPRAADLAQIEADLAAANRRR
jgi:hypothetical protein